VTLTGCGAGQDSQTASQQAAVNGTSAGVGTVELRNVHLRAPQTGDYVRPGADAELLFVAINGAPATGDRLVSVTSDIGTVALTGQTTLAPAGTLVVGTPDLQPSPLDATEAAATGEAQVALTKPITNGLLYPFTFTFEKAGSQTVQVPISAGETPRRSAAGANDLPNRKPEPPH
jgi:copper(I)-binding protein